MTELSDHGKFAFRLTSCLKLPPMFSLPGGRKPDLWSRIASPVFYGEGGCFFIDQGVSQYKPLSGISDGVKIINSLALYGLKELRSGELLDRVDGSGL